jgi:hypothetical protein
MAAATAAITAAGPRLPPAAMLMLPEFPSKAVCVDMAMPTALSTLPSFSAPITSQSDSNDSRGLRPGLGVGGFVSSQT